MAGGALPGGGLWTGPDIADQTVQVNGRAVHFDFDWRFGPLVTDAEGEPLNRQPGKHSPFWGAFEAWLKVYKATYPPSSVAPRPPPSEQWDNRRIVPFPKGQTEGSDHG